MKEKRWVVFKGEHEPTSVPGKIYEIVNYFVQFLVFYLLILSYSWGILKIYIKLLICNVNESYWNQLVFLFDFRVGYLKPYTQARKQVQYYSICTILSYSYIRKFYVFYILFCQISTTSILFHVTASNKATLLATCIRRIVLAMRIICQCTRMCLRLKLRKPNLNLVPYNCMIDKLGYIGKFLTSAIA